MAPALYLSAVSRGGFTLPTYMSPPCEYNQISQPRGRVGVRREGVAFDESGRVAGRCIHLTHSLTRLSNGLLDAASSLESGMLLNVPQWTVLSLVALSQPIHQPTPWSQIALLPTQASMQEEIAVSARWGGGGGDDKDNDGWKDGRMEGWMDRSWGAC